MISLPYLIRMKQIIHPGRFLKSVGVLLVLFDKWEFDYKTSCPFAIK